MASISMFYLRIFLFTAVPYTLMILFAGLITGHSFSLTALLFQGFFFGLLMSLFLVYFHRYQLKKLDIDVNDPENLKAVQSRSISSPFAKSEVIQKIQSDPKFKQMKFSEQNGTIILRSGVGSNSWGEKISITPSHQNEGQSEYTVTSRPKWAINIIDNGTNLKNVRDLEVLLSGNNEVYT